MGRSSLLFVTLTVSLSSLGSLIQTSQSLDKSDSVRVTKKTHRNQNASDILASELIHSEIHSYSVEGGSHSVDSTASQTLIIPKESERASNENRSWSGITLTPVRTLHHSEPQHQGADKVNTTTTRHNLSSVISEEEGSRITTEEKLKKSHLSIVNLTFLDGSDSPAFPIQNNAGPRHPRVLVLTPCVVLANSNGTDLLWDDMRRTLAFAWELHVFGSASLFILMAVLGVMGLAGACTLPHPLCDALILANTLLILSGSLRGVLLLLDPYGTRQILSRATLAALHNVPLQLFLWAQVALALVTLRGMKLLLFPLKLQHPWMVGGLAISHCTPLLVADLFSSTFSPALPLLLQTLTLCWGLPFCMGIFGKSFAHLHPLLRSSVPHQWVPSKGIEKRAKRVTAVCTLFGFMCFSLQMYSLLWLYGLLGNWRRFGWGWWFSQFWARILELAWGFSLLILGSWIFWTLSRGRSRVNQGRRKGPRAVEDTSLWGTVLASIWKGPLRKSEKTWEDMMPSNWANYNLSRTGFSNNSMCPYDEQPSTITAAHKPDPVSSSSPEKKDGECESILFPLEFDMRPPSPIDLRRSIDDALHHRQLVAESLFAPPLPSWAQAMGADTAADRNGGTITLPAAYVGCWWKLDAESISASKEPVESPGVKRDYNGRVESPAAAHQTEGLDSALSAVMHQHDWSEDDLSDL